MYIIPQNLKNEAIKILKNCFSLISNRDFNNITELFNMFNPSFYISFMLKTNEVLNNIIIKTLELAIPQIDNLFLNSQFRKNNYYKFKSNYRSFTTIFGDIEFDRYYYTDKNKKNGFYFIDKLFSFEKYTKYDALVRAILIDNSVSTNANLTSNRTTFILNNYNDYLSNNIYKNVPRQTIYYWKQNWNLPKVQYELCEGYKNLYVMVDEKWLHEQIRLSTLPEEKRNKHHYIMSKCFITFTSAKTKNKRTKLLNRHVFMTTSDNPWKEFINEIYNIYNFEELENIYLLSDAGSWILAGKSELKLFTNNKVITNICEFHVKEYINRFVRDKDKRKELITTIYVEKNKKKFIRLANEIINNSNNKDKKEKYKNYILKHWKGILNMIDREIRSSMESHISHCIALNFGSRPKGFSKLRIEKYIKLEEYKQNGINIMDLYLNSYNQENFIYNKEDILFSIFENNISSNIPIKSSNNPISIKLNKIAYGF